MKYEKATYYYNDLEKCAEQIKTIKLTVKHKNEHFYSASCVQKVFNFCYDHTHCMLFEYDHSYAEDYLKAAYDYKRYTKKELDEKLKTCYRFLAEEIKDILIMGETGEVNLIYGSH